MAAIGSLVFCTACGNLLETNTGRQTYIECDVCGTQNEDTSVKVIVTQSKDSTFPSTLRTRLRSNVQEIQESEMQNDVLIDQACEKCGNPQVRFYTQQLRSADEGSTVFFRCTKCGHKWNINN